MKRALAIILMLMLMCGAWAEPVLTVNGYGLEFDEVRVYAADTVESYADIVEYYDECLGIDYWALEYAGGTTVAESVKADVFEDLVMLTLFYGEALEAGLTLNDEDLILCAEEAGGAVGSAAESLYRKQLLASRMYGLLVSEMEIDEAAVTATVDPDDYHTIGIEYLFLTAEVPEMDSLLEAGTPLEEIALTTEGAEYGTLTLEADSTDSLVQAAKLLSVGEVSGIIKTDFGLFVIKLTDADDKSAYEEAVANALLTAREEAFAPTYEAMYRAAEYTITDSFKDALKVIGG